MSAGQTPNTPVYISPTTLPNTRLILTSTDNTNEYQWPPGNPATQNMRFKVKVNKTASTKEVEVNIAMMPDNMQQEVKIRPNNIDFFSDAIKAYHFALNSP
jgi:hypothetical protein